MFDFAIVGLYPVVTRVWTPAEITRAMPNAVETTFPLPVVGDRLLVIDGESTQGKRVEDIRAVLDRASQRGFTTLLLG